MVKAEVWADHVLPVLRLVVGHLQDRCLSPAGAHLETDPWRSRSFDG
jgi:hypothetical protein